MTVHWLDPSTLKRHKAAIACARLTGHHTYDVLAGKIIDIHEKFGLSGKTSATVTDNGSNFVKAFATFALPDVSPTSSVTEDELEEEVIFENVNDLMVPEQIDTQDDLTQIEYELPPHQRCAATWLPVLMLTNFFHHLHCQETYTEVLSVNVRLYGTRQAVQPLPQIRHKKD